MDATVLDWMQILRSNAKDEDGIELYPLEVKERVLKRCLEYLEKRKKLLPPEERKEGVGVTNLRQALNDPEFEQAMAAAGYVKVKAAGKGAVVRDRDAELAKAATGSALRAAMFDGEGLEGVTTDV